MYCSYSVTVYQILRWMRCSNTRCYR